MLPPNILVQLTLLSQCIGSNNDSCTNILLETCQFRQYIGGNMSVPPIGKELQTGSTKNNILQIFLMLAAPIYWCKMVSSTIALVRYKGN
jgi:hypothetical protein